jgi:hypothetical protein
VRQFAIQQQQETLQQSLLVLLVRVGWKEGKALGSEGEIMESRLFRWICSSHDGDYEEFCVHRPDVT